MKMDTLTLVHVAISLIAILSGFVVLWGMIRNRRMDKRTLVFLAFTAATNLTGFVFFPITVLTPALILGVVSSVVLLICILARYVFAMRGVWRPVYVVTAVIVLWFNVFVLNVQSFKKIAALHALLPAGSEPFAIGQGIVLIAFIVTGLMAVMRFRP